MTRRFKNWISTYVEHTKHSEAPDVFHRWTAIATIAGALRRKVWLNMGYFKWYPNFYIFFVAPPGVVSKSTTASLGMDLLAEVDGIHFGPASASWQALVQFMGGIGEEFLLPDGQTFMPMSAVTVVASELGTFLDPTNRDQTDVMVSLWDGKEGAWDKLTKTSGSDQIINPWIHMIGCTTPSWIAENMTDYFTGGGMASRSVFVYAEKKRRLVAYPQRLLPADFETVRQELVLDLDEISQLAGSFKITEEAMDWGEEWYKKHWEGEHPHIPQDKFKGYLARKQTHIHKLAMVLSVARSEKLVIEKDDLMEANNEVTKLESDMPAVFGQMNREAEMVLAADILDIVRTRKKVERMKVYRDFVKAVSIDTFDKIIKSLIASGLMRMTNQGGAILLHAVFDEDDDENNDQQVGVG